MPYPITYNGIEGQAGLYATVRRRFDGKWFRSLGDWVADVAFAALVQLGESPDEPGRYTADANFNPADGMVYVIAVYDRGVLLFESEHLASSQQQTIMEMINTVQAWLRLPQSGVITEGHAALLLGFANEVQLDYMADFVEWDELKMECAFSVLEGQSCYSIFPAQGAAVDVVKELKIGDATITKATDKEFRDARDGNDTPDQPTLYRIYGRAGKALLIEVWPTPDTIYRVDASLLQRPIRMTDGADVPLLDQDTIMLGMKFLARKDQGEDYQPELSTFQAKLSLRAQGDARDIDFL